MFARTALTLFLAPLVLLGCSEKPAEENNPPGPQGTTDDTGTPDTTDTGTAGGDDTDTGSTDPVDTDTGGATNPVDTDTGEPPEPEPDVAAFGFEDARELVRVGTAADGLDTPRDLAFHPERDELWVLSRFGATTGYGGGSNVIWFGPETDDAYSEFHSDYYANHFMAQPSSMAFGEATFSGSTEVNFATCQESRNDYGGAYAPNDFMGPALWNSDLTNYGQVNQGPPSQLGGSHLDMLHQSPLCMGIVHETGNAYWAFDGNAGNLIRYDFAADHDAGHDDHSDGIVRRYTDAEVSMVSDVPSHLVFYDNRLVLAADSGNGRVISLDIHTGSFEKNLSPFGEYLAEYSEYTGADVQVVVDGLDTPSGMALDGDILYIGDQGTGEIIAFDLAEGVELDRVSTGAGSLGALAVSPSGLLWYLDNGRDELRYINPGQ